MIINSDPCLDPLATRRFIQIPGPNPIVVRGGPREWDERCIEGGDIELAACPPISLESVSDLVLGVRCTVAPQATAGVRVHVRASHDGFVYDTEDWTTFEAEFAPGQETGRTVKVSAKPQFIKVLAENLDPHHDVTALTVTATLGCR